MDVERPKDQVVDDVKRDFTKFLEEFTFEENGNIMTYRQVINDWVEGTGNVLVITSEHLAIFNNELYEFIFDLYYKY